MSRVAKQPVVLPKGVEVTINDQLVKAKGSIGAAELLVHDDVAVSLEDGELRVAAKRTGKDSIMMAGTMRSLLNNLIVGVSSGFEKRLELRGVGYRAQAQGNSVNLTLGFSHPVSHPVPQGITVETPSQTEIIVKGIDKQVVGQVASDIRAYRPPEPYKGKGVRYVNENVVMKEAKKK
ncbi:MAG: 50S ribosomal protein L6 [Gammaproteobacteria bacterium]|nr:50S ribosomal protein L6 [Gammaproteobacteria bacterium]